MGFKKKVQETPKKINLLNEDEEADYPYRW